MLRQRWLLTLSLVMLPPLSGLARTAIDLRHKYKVSSRIESYDVRPGIIAVVSHGEGGQVASILFRLSPSAHTLNYLTLDQIL